MVKETKLYEDLGASPTATDDDLKRLYKRSALKFHPDKNQNDPAAAEKFKEISHAYEILSDPQKRSIYDQYGEAGLEGAGGGGGMAAEDLFAQFFGGGGGGFGGLGGMFGGGGQRGPTKPRTINHVHKVTLEDIYRGKVSKLALQRSIVCVKCDGRGGRAVFKCNTCGGRGTTVLMRQMGPMIQRFQTVCPDCNGEGESIKDKDRCKNCNGKKTIVDRKVLHVEVKRGIKSGTRIDFEGEGDQAPGLPHGDVVFEIEQKPHDRFLRQGNDLAYKCDIDLITALAGGTFFIQHLDDRWLEIEILPGEAIRQDSVKMVRNEGMPILIRGGEFEGDFGNLHIMFNIRFPPKNWTDNEAHFEALREILPPAAPSSISTKPGEAVKPPAGALVKQADLDEVDAQASSSTGMDVDDDDDDADVHGGNTVQCPAQ